METTHTGSNIVTRLLKAELTPGILLCLAAVLAMMVENFGFHEIYDQFKSIPVTFRAGSFLIDKPLLLWINDGLMAIFFLLVGLEIKREVLEGHLSRLSDLVLPVVAAVGGLTVPALIYFAMNADDPVTRQGWAIPAATDIAFALGVLVMLGKRVPPALKVCLVAIAIIDDLAAIVIIALFYTAETSIIALSLAAAGLLIVFAMNRAGVNRLGPYLLMGLFIWACVLKSGVHATLAGVALGLLIPMQSKRSPESGYSPLRALEHSLHPFVALLVLPLFAFVNAGVSFAGLSLETFLQPITLGILAGLFIGKQVGVMSASYLAVRLGWCQLPTGVSWLQLYGMAVLTGIGFTMSLFIGTLAFVDVQYLTAVRLGVISASVLAAITSVTILTIAARRETRPVVHDSVSNR